MIIARIGHLILSNNNLIHNNKIINRMSINNNNYKYITLHIHNFKLLNNKKITSWIKKINFSNLYHIIKPKIKAQTNKYQQEEEGIETQDKQREEHQTREQAEKEDTIVQINLITSNPIRVAY